MDLPERCREVAKLAVQGMTSREIADAVQLPRRRSKRVSMSSGRAKERDPTPCRWLVSGSGAVANLDAATPTLGSSSASSVALASWSHRVRRTAVRRSLGGPPG